MTKKEQIVRLRMKDGLKNNSKKPWNRKSFWTVAAVLTVFICCGYIFYVPKLINADKPFIDLSGSLGDAIGSAESAVMSGNRDTDDVNRPTAAVTPTPIPRQHDENAEYITIRVSDDIITVNGIRVENFEEFRSRITGKAFADKSFEIIDDYAELKTFRKALRILDECECSYIVRTEE